MSERTREYEWYLTGCRRLAQTAMPLDEFCTLWQRYEDYAETLKTHDEAGTLNELDQEDRRRVEAEFRSNPLMRAVLIGQSEDTSSS